MRDIVKNNSRRIKFKRYRLGNQSRKYNNPNHRNSGGKNENNDNLRPDESKGHDLQLEMVHQMSNSCNSNNNKTIPRTVFMQRQF